jgi:Zn-finger nucleic acid-binding protein
MILACVGCDSRYDVSGFAVGQQFRCRCGTVSTLDAPRPEAGLLACPQCAANVAATQHHCDHCTTPLLLKACPRCLSRVFHGHKHCPECGCEIALAAHGAEHSDTPCPRCDQSLGARLVGDVLIDECSRCHGVFLDQVAVQRVVTDRRQSRAETLLGALTRAEVNMVPHGGRMYVKCPTCHNLMNRKQFATGAGVVIDVCRTHGTFFDAGELPRIIEFVMNGGLEAAERADLQRLRDQTKREVQQAQQATLADSRLRSGHSDGWTGLGPRSSSGSAVVSLLISLFR